MLTPVFGRTNTNTNKQINTMLNAHPSVWEDMYEVGGSVAQIILNMGEHHSWYSGYLLVLLLFSIVTY